MESKRCAAMLLASVFLTGALPAFAGERSDAFVAAARRAYAADSMCRTTIVTNFDVKGSPDDKTPGLVRWYDVEGARNVRDIGGWTGLRAGRVFRGTELNSKPNHKQYELTERGRAVMRGEMGIVSDLDLRGEIAEYGEDAKTKSPIGEGVQLLSRPVSSYVETCASPHSAKAFANALRVFADEKNYPVYVHCAGGADRTGTVCFLLETLCGASLEDATIEYELTSFSPVGMRRRNCETGLPFALMVRLLSTFPGETFADKVAYWAENVAGLTKEEIARIRANICKSSASAQCKAVGAVSKTGEPFPDKSRVVFFGDSITSMGGALLRVAAQYLAEFPGRDVRFFNLGISGGGFDAANLYFDSWLAPLKPTHVVLAFGVNDAGPLRVDENAQDAASEAVRICEAAKKFRARYAALVERIEALGAKVTVRAITPYDETAREEAIPVQKGRGDAFRLVAEQIRAVAAERGLPLVDDNARMSGLLAAGERLFNPDRVHPNNFGQWRLAETFLAAQGLAIAPYRPRRETAAAAGISAWDDASSRLSIVLSAEWLLVRDESLDVAGRLAKVRSWLDARKDASNAKSSFVENTAQAYLRDKPIQDKLLAGIDVCAVASPWGEVVEKGAPIAHEAEGFTGKAKAVFLDGEDWRGRQTRFFAWYGVPEGTSATNKCPAVVLVHGGAGTAFDWWVRMWNERGYAAIAMDTCGAVPRKESDGGKSWKRHEWSGPGGWGGFDQIDEPERDQWTYHAVADVILSHSFLRALSEVDAARIGITGISWGGYLTCIAASVDHRFSWAAPVYGCGFYADESAWAKELSGMGARGDKWLRTWDAGKFLPYAECPFLFVSGTSDRFFKVPMLKKSAAAVKAPVFFDIRESMPHSQQAGAAPESVRSFADHWSFGKQLSPDISNQWMVRKMAFASVEAARDAARTMPKPAVVHLAAGVHRLEKPLVLGPEDSGVTYVADGNVVISGARPVTDWRVEVDGTWSAPVPWVRSDRTGGFRSLCVNGAMRPRARLPKEGHFTVVNDDLPDGTRYNVPRPSFFYDPKEFNPEWTNLGDAEIVCFHFWTDSHLRIASVDIVSNKVTFVTPSGKAFDTGWSNNKAGGLRGIYTIENLPAAMTEPGEWWLEYGAARVHYKPMPGEMPDAVKAEVPFCSELVIIEGTPEKGGRYVEDVVFRGIRFELSQFELKGDDVNDAQGAATVSAAVRLVGARRCRFEDCVFVNLGGYVADILKGSRDNAFSRCTMTRLGAGGVRLDGGKAGCPPVELTSGNAITDCEIGPYGLDFRSAVGVLLKNAERTSIVHNHIHDGYYTGVSAGWVWGYYPSVCRENEISHNHIHDIGKGLLSDMGGIYTLGPSYGMRIANNRIHDVDASRYGGWGIYHDEGTVGALVENNVVYDTKFAPFNIHYAKDVTVRNNIFAFGRSDTISRSRREPHVSCELLNNIFYWTEGRLYSGDWSDAETPFPVHRRGNKLEANKAGSTVTFNADRNVYFNPTLSIGKVAFGGGKSLEDWRKMGKDIHSVYANPQFRDATARDFRLLPDSPAFRLGFVDFDQCDIGPKPQR